MHDLPGDLVKQKIGGMSIAETKDVPDHRVDTQTSCIGNATFKPSFGISALEPQDTVKILTSGVVERVLEDLDLVQKWKTIIALVRHLNSISSVQ